jgi:hypothetical protein
MGRFQDVFSLLGRSHAKRCPFTDGVALPHQDHEEEEGEDGEEGHHSVDPADGDRGNPVVDVKVNRQSQEQTHGVDWNCRLDSVASEALGDY